jgi:hypothetical protein
MDKRDGSDALPPIQFDGKIAAYNLRPSDRTRKMIKMQIKMDEKKIQREGHYSLQKIYGTLDDYFVNRLNTKKEGNGFYVGTDSPSDFGNFGLAMVTLGKKPWFMENVDTWLYFNSDDSEDPEDYVVEDFKKTCLERLYTIT